MGQLTERVKELEAEFKVNNEVDGELFDEIFEEIDKLEERIEELEKRPACDTQTFAYPQWYIGTSDGTLRGYNV